MYDSLFITITIAAINPAIFCLYCHATGEEREHPDAFLKRATEF
jgi:hypothetical protein